MTTLSIFPKFLKSLPLPELGPRLRDAGLDACNLVIRKDYWVQPDDAPRSIPGFVASLRAAGVAVPACTWAEGVDQVLAAEATVAAMADAGIRSFRVGYFQWDERGGPLSGQLRRAADLLRRLQPLLERYRMQALYQVHHGTLISSPSLAALLLEDLPPTEFAVKLDAGNQGFEGMEAWDRAARMLGSRWAALGVKDTRVDRRGGRPRRGFCPCPDGDNDWDAVARAWRARQAAQVGLWVLQPFYHEQDATAHLATLTQEVAFVRAALGRAEETG